MDADISVITSKIEQEKSYLEYVSNEIWSNPELCFEEVRAHEVLTTALEKYGFEVQKHYLLPTAFRAEFTSKADAPEKPVIAVLCEYDALPEIGHACGHNLIAEVGLAAAIGIKAAMESNSSLVGKVVVLGCPAEEGGGGKIRLLEKGAFQGIDAAMMAHPAKVNMAFARSLCIERVDVTFKGKEAHASAYPWEGHNALDAAVACYVSIGLLRQQIKPSCRVHGIITKGGTAPNIIPGETGMRFYIRALTLSDLESLHERVTACFESSAKSTGCQVEYNFHDEVKYINVITNSVLGNLYKTHCEAMGVKFTEMSSSNASGGSTDMGNVSQVIPSIHPFFSIGDGCAIHTKDFTKDAGMPYAQESTLTAAKAIALTSLSIMRSEELRQKMRETFEEDRKTNLSVSS